MKSKFLITILFLAFVMNSYGQIDFTSNGEILVGQSMTLQGGINVNNSTFPSAIYVQQSSGQADKFGVLSKVSFPGQKSFASVYGATQNFYVLHNGEVYSNGIKLTSDQRFKKNILPITSYEKLMLLKPVSYQLDYSVYKTRYYNQLVRNNISAAEASTLTINTWTESNETNYGFIAQEVQQIFPELVSADEEGYLSLNYIGLIPFLVEGLKEQKSIIETQQKEIVKLADKLIKIEQELAKLKGNKN